MRKLLTHTLLFCSLLFIQHIKAQKGVIFPLWFNSSASIWNQALPVGNECLDAMIHGDPDSNYIYLDTASGTDTNLFFEIADIKDPLISDSLKKTVLYDLPPETGETYILINIEQPDFCHVSLSDNDYELILVELSELINTQVQSEDFTRKPANWIETFGSMVPVGQSNQPGMYLNDIPANVVPLTEGIEVISTIYFSKSAIFTKERKKFCILSHGRC